MSYEDKAPQALVTLDTATEGDVTVDGDGWTGPAGAGGDDAATVTPLAPEPTDNTAAMPTLIPDTSARTRAFPYLVAALLLAFGIYQSVLYYGHQVVPNPDFPGFLRVGHELLALEMPSSFKRAPVLGLLQAALSHVVGGAHPELTAGWLLNAVLHPLSLLFLWLIGRRIIGRAACWFVLLAALNPWMLRNLSDPIAETTLHFFIVATLCAIFARSRWRYPLAAVATMVRYDAAALIVVAFVLDMVQGSPPHRRRKAVLGATLACVPLAIWLLATFLHFDGEGSTHYLNELGTGGGLVGAAARYVKAFWLVAVSPLFEIPPSLPKPVGVSLVWVVRVVFLTGLCLGLVRTFIRRQWELIGLLIFLSLYVAVHSLHSFVLTRFCSSAYWIVLLVICFGLQGLWSRLRRRVAVPDRMLPLLQAAGCVVLALWAFDIARLLPVLAGYGVRSASLPAASIVLGGSLVACERRCLPRTSLMQRLLLLCVFCGVIVSNQYTITAVIANGQRDVEFKELAEWCRDHTQPGEKTASTYSGMLGIYVPDRKADFIHLSVLQGDSLEAFTENCRQADVAYVAWDSRLGASEDNRYHDLCGLDALTELARPASVGPYEFVMQITTDLGACVNVFRLRSSDATR